MKSMLKRSRGRGTRKGISTVVATIFFVMMLAIAIAFIEIVWITSSIALREQTNIIEERLLSAELAKTVTGWWEITRDGFLEVNITTNSPYPVTLSGLAIIYADGGYDVIGPNIDTIGDRLIKAVLRRPDGTYIDLEQPVLPVTLGYGESLLLRIIPRTDNIVSVSTSIAKPDSPAISSIPVQQYVEYVANVTRPGVTYTVVLAPTIMGEGTVATTGYSYAVKNFTPIDVTVYNGSSTDPIESMFYNDDIYYTIDSVKTEYTGPWLNGWSHRIEIVVTENTGTTLTDYQLKMVVDNTTVPEDILESFFSNTQPNGEDVRFTLEDGVTEIPFWIQEWDPVNRRAVIWVKIPELPGGATIKIYMYYGNPDAEPKSNLLDVIEDLPASDGENYIIYYEPWVMNESLLTTPPYYFRRYFGDDAAYRYQLPFTFPYYSKTYSSVYIVSNGHVDLGAYWTDWTSTIGEFKSRRMISPFWADLYDGDGPGTTYCIMYDPGYSDEYGSGVYILWRTQFYRARGRQVFGVVLYSNGLIRFDYGTIIGTSSTDHTPVIGVSLGDRVHYTLLVDSDSEPPSNWDNHPSILLWPRKKASIEPSYVFTKIQKKIEYIVDVAVIHSIPENTTYGTIYVELQANSTVTIEYYLWNGDTWVYAGEQDIAEPDKEYTLTFNYNSSYVVDSDITYLLKVRSINSFVLGIDYSIAKAIYPTSDLAIYVGVGGSNTILMYSLNTESFSEVAIKAPSGVVFNGSTAIVCDDKGTLWIASGTSLYYYDEEAMAWRYYASIPEALGHGASLLYYRGQLYVIVGGGSSSLYVYDVGANETVPTRIDLGYSIGDYSVAAIARDAIYIAVGGGNNTFIKYNITTGTITKLESTPSTRLVGLAYDRDREYLWAICEGGGMYYYIISTNTWKPLDTLLPYTPIGEGNRLIYYNNKLYHFRDNDTRELWIITLQT